MKKIITISREFGSGGRSIGKAVAEELGFAYYDKEMIEKLSKATGLTAEYIEKHGEHSPGRNIFSYAFVGRNIAGMSVGDYLFTKQREMILNLAEQGNCVIVGRCADYILKDRADCLHVFIHADKDSRMERIVKLYGETEQDPSKRLADMDKARKSNYKYYTERNWGESQNYHISLCSSELGPDRCIELIASLAREL